MKPLTAEWVQKADDDFIVAQKMFRARKQPVMMWSVFMRSSVPKNT
jgi:hypothetical protein